VNSLKGGGGNGWERRHRYDFCRTLCEVGCEVYFCSRNVEKGQLAVKSLGRRAHYYQTDLAAPDQIKAFADYVGKLAGRVDYLVNNARMMTGSSLLTLRSRNVTACGL